MIEEGSSPHLDAGDDRTSAEAALLEFLARRGTGEDIDFATFCGEHPALAGELEVLYARYRDAGLASLLESDGAQLHLDDLMLDGEASDLSSSLAIDAGLGPEGGSPAEVLAWLASPLRFRDHYRSEGEVARGGMGVVRRVWDARLRRLIAMKVVRPRARAALVDDASSAESVNSVDELSLARFLDEALVTSQLDHPGIVPVHELGVDDKGNVYFTMKLVKGDDLRTLIAKVPGGEDGWTLNRAVGVLRRVCEAVAYAHSKGVVHRDIKPANIMVGRYGESYLMDWGLARVLGTEIGRDALAAADGPPVDGLRDADLEEALDDALEADSWLFTQDGKVVGTPVYMSPEQACGEVDLVDGRSDIYSLGAILYHLLTARMPYVEPGEHTIPFLVLMQVRRGPPVPVRDLAPDAPPTLLEICERAMAREPSDRYPSAADMADALGDYLEDISEAREEARRQARRADMINGFLVEMLSSGEPYRAMGADVTVREVVDRASARIASALPEQPLDEAALRRTIGVIYSQLGRYEEAELHLETAHRLLREHLGDDAHEVLDTAIDLAVVMRHSGRFAASEALLRHALASLEPRLGERHLTTLRAMDNLAAAVRLAGGDLDEVESLLRCALDGRLALRGEDHVETVCSLHGLGQFLRDRARFDEAEFILRRALEIARRMRGDSNIIGLIVMNDLGSVLTNQGRYEEAQTVLVQAIAALEQSVPGHPMLLLMRNNLGLCKKRMGDAPGAVTVLASVVAAWRARGELDSEGVVALNNLGTALEAVGDVESAVTHLDEALRRAEVVFGASHRNTSRLRTNLGRCLVAAGSLDAGRAQLEQALAELRPSLGDEHPWTREVVALLARLEG
ncbi:MAG: serine/threonine protein kinase [Planctomycetes bacterium]|nr:serine/threonine protein kinase [Planctomycetota bacterium]